MEGEVKQIKPCIPPEYFNDYTVRESPLLGGVKCESVYIRVKSEAPNPPPFTYSLAYSTKADGSDMRDWETGFPITDDDIQFSKVEAPKPKKWYHKLMFWRR